MEELYTELDELFSHSPSDVEQELGQVYHAIMDEEDDDLGR